MIGTPKRSSDFWQFHSQTASEDGTEGERPKSELVPCLDINCTCMYRKCLKSKLLCVWISDILCVWNPNFWRVFQTHFEKYCSLKSELFGNWTVSEVYFPTTFRDYKNNYSFCYLLRYLCLLYTGSHFRHLLYWLLDTWGQCYYCCHGLSVVWITDKSVFWDFVSICILNGEKIVSMNMI